MPDTTEQTPERVKKSGTKKADKRPPRKQKKTPPELRERLSLYYVGSMKKILFYFLPPLRPRGSRTVKGIRRGETPPL